MGFVVTWSLDYLREVLERRQRVVVEGCYSGCRSVTGRIRAGTSVASIIYR